MNVSQAQYVLKHTIPYRMAMAVPIIGPLGVIIFKVAFALPLYLVYCLATAFWHAFVGFFESLNDDLSSIGILGMFRWYTRKALVDEQIEIARMTLKADEGIQRQVAMNQKRKREVAAAEDAIMGRK